MKKGFFLIIIILLVFGSFRAASLSEAKDDLSKHDRQLLEEFNLSLKDGANGRFQTTKIDDTSILIIDTKLGYLWVFNISPDVVIKYAGKIRPGETFWDTIYKRD